MNPDLRSTVRLFPVQSESVVAKQSFTAEFTKALLYLTYWVFLVTILVGCVFILDLIVRVWP